MGNKISYSSRWHARRGQQRRITNWTGHVLSAALDLPFSYVGGGAEDGVYLLLGDDESVCWRDALHGTSAGRRRIRTTAIPSEQGGLLGPAAKLRMIASKTATSRGAWGVQIPPNQACGGAGRVGSENKEQPTPAGGPRRMPPRHGLLSSAAQIVLPCTRREYNPVKSTSAQSMCWTRRSFDSRNRSWVSRKSATDRRRIYRASRVILWSRPGMESAKLRVLSRQLRWLPGEHERLVADGSIAGENGKGGRARHRVQFAVDARCSLSWAVLQWQTWWITPDGTMVLARIGKLGALTISHGRRRGRQVLTRPQV